MSEITQPTILVIEDEPKVAAFIKKGLQTQAFVVTTAANGRDGITLAQNQSFNLVILDLNLPDMSGLDVCSRLREQHLQMPVLMLTALGTVADKLAGFDVGADDYLVKPFEFMELLARVKVLLKRAYLQTQVAPAQVLQVADLELDMGEKVARRNGQRIELTAREFALLEYLMRNRGRVVSRVDIAENVWDINFDTGTNIIDVYMNYVRNKVDKGFASRLIHTVVGMGYILKEK